MLAALQSLSGQTSGVSAEINTEVVEAISHILSNGMDSSAKDSLRKLYEPSVTHERLRVIPCNPEIFHQASAEVKKMDREWQNIQGSLLAGITALAKGISVLVEGKKGDLNDVLVNAISLCCQASHDMDLQRRQLYKDCINEEYKALCQDSYPVQNLLFSKDLGERIKNLNETMKITRSLTTRVTGRGRKRAFPFLGSGQKDYQQNQPKSQRQQREQGRPNFFRHWRK